MSKIKNAKVVSLGEVTMEVTRRNTLNDEYQVWSVTNDAGLINSRDYFKKRVYSKNLKNYKIIAPNEIAYNPSRINVGSIALNNLGKNGLLSPLYVILKCTEDILPQFLIHFLTNREGNRRIRHYTQGSVRDNLTYQNFKKIKLNLPPIKTQQKMVAILDQITKIKRKQNTTSKYFNLLIQSIFLELFGDPSTNPKNFPLKEIQEFTKVGTGGTPKRNVKEYYGGSIPWIKTGEARNEVIITSEETITQLGLENSNATVYPIDTILIAMYGQGKTRGMTANLGIPAATNQAFACVLPSESHNPNYLWFLMMLSYEKLRSQAHGGNQPNLNTGMIKSFKIPLPPLELQNQFSSSMNKIKKIQKIFSESINNSNNLYATIVENILNTENH